MLHSPQQRMVLLFCLILFQGLPLQAQDPPEQDAIDEVNRLGRMLYDYDQAAWHGSDAIMPLIQENPESMGTTVQGYVVDREEEEWVVLFGRLSSDSSAYMVTFEARLDPEYQVSNTVAYEEAESYTGFPVEAGLALSLAKADFEKPQQVAYNSVVLPVNSDSLYVYFMPAPPAYNVFYVGSDHRYTYDSRTRQLTGSKPLHNSMLTLDLRGKDDAITMSNAVLTDIPTETDVFYAMSRPGAPGKITHYLVTKKWAFRLDVTGIVSHMDPEEWESMIDE